MEFTGFGTVLISQLINLSGGSNQSTYSRSMTDSNGRKLHNQYPLGAALTQVGILDSL